MGAELINDGFAAAGGEINFDIDAKTFFGDENRRVIAVFLEDAESAEIVVAVEFASFGETFVADGVGNFARGAERGDEDGDGA